MSGAFQGGGMAGLATAGTSNTKQDTLPDRLSRIEGHIRELCELSYTSAGRLGIFQDVPKPTASVPEEQHTVAILGRIEQKMQDLDGMVRQIRNFVG